MVNHIKPKSESQGPLITKIIALQGLCVISCKTTPVWPDRDLVKMGDNEVKPTGPPYGMFYRGVFDIQPKGVAKYICVAVYAVMCSYAYPPQKNPNGTKICRISQRRIAEILGCSKPVVVWSIRELREQGYIRLIGKSKAGVVGTQYEIIPRVYSEDTCKRGEHMQENMCKTDEHMPQNKPDLPHELMRLTPIVNEVNSNGKPDEHITENNIKLNKPTENDVGGGVDNSSDEKNPKWVEAANDVMKAFGFHCPNAEQPTLDEVYDAVVMCRRISTPNKQYTSMNIKEAIKKCDSNTKTWKGTLYHLKNMIPALAAIEQGS